MIITFWWAFNGTQMFSFSRYILGDPFTDSSLEFLVTSPPVLFLPRPWLSDWTANSCLRIAIEPPAIAPSVKSSRSNNIVPCTFLPHCPLWPPSGSVMVQQSTFDLCQHILWNSLKPRIKYFLLQLTGHRELPQEVLGVREGKMAMQQKQVNWECGSCNLLMPSVQMPGAWSSTCHHLLMMGSCFDTLALWLDRSHNNHFSCISTTRRISFCSWCLLQEKKDSFIVVVEAPRSSGHPWTESLDLELAIFFKSEKPAYSIVLEALILIRKIYHDSQWLSKSCSQLSTAFYYQRWSFKNLFYHFVP